MKAVIYCRVSSREQEETGYSLPAQEKFLRDYANKNGFTIAKVFAVSESAGGKTRRKIFHEMIEYIRKHKISVVIVETTDRLTRNFADVPTIDAWILENEDNQIHLAKEGCVLNKNSKSHEWFMWRVKVATAEYYVKLLSENVRKGQKEKIAQGWLPQRPRLGYKTIGERGHKIHVTDEEKMPFVRETFELYSTGNYSLKKLVEVMYQKGLRNERGGKFGKSRMHCMLSDPFYIGKIVWNGQTTKGEHETFIPNELFQEVQRRLTRNVGSPKYSKHDYVFKAKIKCEECKGTIAWEIQKGHWYGHCNHHKQCSQKTWSREEDVEEQLFPLFDKVAPKNNRIVDWLGKALKESHEGEIDYNTQQREQFNIIIRTADRRMENAYKDKLDGRVPISLSEKVISDSIKEKDDALESLNKLGETRVKYYEAGYAIHELAMRAKDIYQSKNATTEEKRLLLSMVFSNLTFDEGKIKPNYTLAFDFLLKWMPIANKNFEPAKMANFTNKTSDFSPVLNNSDTRLRR